MERIKLFYCYTDDGEDGVEEAQEKIDKWFAANPKIEIINFKTTMADEEHITTLHYDDNKEKEMFP